MKKLLSVCLVLVMVLSLAACGDKATETKGEVSNEATTDNKTEGNTTPSGETKELIIGGMGPLTGPAASYGISVKQGTEIAVNEINANGGITVGGVTYMLKSEFADDEATEDKAINAYNSLIDKGMHVLVGPTTSGAVTAVRDLSYQDNILLVTPSGSTADCISTPNAFRICFTDPIQGETMADFIVNQQGYKKIAVLYANSSDYSIGIKDAFVAKVKELGGTIVAEESFAEGDVDYNTQLTSVKATDAEAIFVPAYYTEATYITKQAAENGINLPFFGSDGWDGIHKTVTDAATVEGAIFLSPFFVEDTSELVSNFVAAYREAYNADPDQFGADAYDAVYAIKAAMEKADSIETEAVIQAMTEISINGLTGQNMSFTAEGEPNKGAMFLQIKDGKYVAYTAE